MANRLICRCRRYVSLIVMVTQCAGCYRWAEIPVTETALVRDPASTVRVTLKDGSRATLLGPTEVVGDSVRDAGWGAYQDATGVPVSATAVADIVSVEVRELNGGATAAWAVLWSLVGITTVVVILSSPDEPEVHPPERDCWPDPFYNWGYCPSGGR